MKETLHTSRLKCILYNTLKLKIGNTLDNYTIHIQNPIRTHRDVVHLKEQLIISET